MVQVCRYVTPLREGGSLPGLTEADDGFLYVLKFRGAGQGVKALVAEFLGGELARAGALKIPEGVFALLDEAFGRTEPDEEIQDLLRASTGLNLGLHYLSGSITYDIAVVQPDALLASKIVWLDALIFNVDRTVRNPNMLFWKDELWLIDHGAAFFFHHNWEGREAYIHKPFVQIKDHVLLPYATRLAEADAFFKEKLSPEIIERLTAAIPDDWLHWPDTSDAPDEIRAFYKRFLTERIADSSTFVKAAEDARLSLV